MLENLDIKEQRKWFANCLRDKILLKNNCQWEYLLELCNWEGIGPLLYMKLKDVDNIPKGFITALKSLYIWNRVQNNMFIREIRNISDSLNIPIILLKGAALIMSVYEEVSLRPMSDVDILVREKDLQKVDHFLEENGYKITAMEYNKWDRMLGSGRTYTKDMINIDLFTNIEILYIGNSANKRIFSKALCVEKNIFIPCPEDLLLHCLIHMSTHHILCRLIWLYDINKIIEKCTIDWDKVCSFIENMGLKSLLLMGLKEAKDLFEIDLPDILEKRLTERRYMKSIRFNMENITYLLSLPGIKNKFLLIVSSIFPSEQYLRIRFHINNPLLLLMHKIIRPFFVIFKTIKKISGL